MEHTLAHIHIKGEKHTNANICTHQPAHTYRNAHTQENRYTHILIAQLWIIIKSNQS